MIHALHDNMRFRLTEQNYIMYAMKHYNNPQCMNIDEFYNDLKRIKYIKRLLSRYVLGGELKERLILNHLIILYNSFGIEATKLLFFRIDRQFWPQLKTFLVYLSYMPEILAGIDEKPILNTDITLDPVIIGTLRKR